MNRKLKEVKQLFIQVIFLPKHLTNITSLIPDTISKRYIQLLSPFADKEN
jgi:hypothetical protein